MLWFIPVIIISMLLMAYISFRYAYPILLYSLAAFIWIRRRFWGVLAFCGYTALVAYIARLF